MLDTIRRIETPEGVELELTCAGIYARSIAWLVDGLIQLLVVVIFLFLLPRMGDFGQGLLFILLFLLHWLYPVFFEIYMQGQTPGKRLMNIQVLLIDGSMINWGASLLRNLLRTVDFLPFLYVLGLLTMLMSKDFRRLGDLAANTIVVYKRQLQPLRAIAQTQAHAPDISLSAIEQQSIINYAERLTDFSPERAEELALLATPLLEQLTQTSSDKQTISATRRILAVANYLLGRR